jgi:hypothetical protein
LKNAKKKSQPNWLRLSLYKNCFGENEGTHLGLRYNKRFWCITHSGGSNGVIIPKKHLRMKEISTKLEYLKECKVVPEVLHTTNMYIDESFLIKAILENALNK